VRTIEHGTNAREFGLMVKAGVPPKVALQAATVTAAEVLEARDDLGSLEAGRLADLVAVPGNPLEEITVMEKVDFVMKEGVVYKKP